MVSNLVIFILFITCIHSSTIYESSSIFKCYGNYQQFQGKCIPCKYGTVAIKGKCVPLNLSFTYGSNLVDKIDENCEANRYFFGVCLKCKKDYFLDQDSTCKPYSLCELFDIQTQRCIKKVQQSMEILNARNSSNKINNKPPEQGYVLTHEEQLASIHTSYKAQQLQLITIDKQKIPNLFVPLKNTTNTQLNTNKTVFLIHKNKLEVGIMKYLCQTPKNGICECPEYFYNGVVDKCFKTAQKLLVKQNITIQEVDPNCEEWQIKAQKYMCIKCRKNYAVNRDGLCLIN